MAWEMVDLPKNYLKTKISHQSKYVRVGVCLNESAQYIRCQMNVVVNSLFDVLLIPGLTRYHNEWMNAI